MSHSSKGNNYRHGAAGTPEYRAWHRIKYRCESKKSKDYQRYGGRGIRVCLRWNLSVQAFLTDMGPRPSPRHEIDRIDNDGHYSCGKCDECRANGWTANCRWATKKTQANNRRANRLVIWNGITRTVAEWSDITGLTQGTILSRLKLGWKSQDVLTRPVGRQIIYLECGGERLTLQQWSKRLGIPRDALFARHRRGWTAAQIVGAAPKPKRRV